MEIKINDKFIKLDSFLKLCAAAQTGGEAKMIIQDGLVKVNGEIETRRGKKLYPKDEVEFDGNIYIVGE